jgi:hypothetical protein
MATRYICTNLPIQRERAAVPVYIGDIDRRKCYRIQRRERGERRGKDRHMYMYKLTEENVTVYKGEREERGGEKTGTCTCTNLPIQGESSYTCIGGDRREKKLTYTKEREREKERGEK